MILTSLERNKVLKYCKEVRKEISIHYDYEYFPLIYSQIEEELFEIIHEAMKEGL